MNFTFLDRRLTIRVKAGYSLIACIRQDTNVLCHNIVTLLEQLKIVLLPVAEIRGQDEFCVQVGYQLRFLGVTLLFAAVMALLSFFGRSIGCSVASTKIISRIASLGCSAFFPGR